MNCTVLTTDSFDAKKTRRRKKEAREMAKSWKALKAEVFTPEQLERIDADTDRMVAEMPLAYLRAARAFSQSQLAESMGVKQASISKMEHQADMYVGTLRRYLQAMGGDLEIVARFPDGDVRITQFGDLDRASALP